MTPNRRPALSTAHAESVSLGVLLRVHDRPLHTRIVLGELARYASFPGVDVRVVVAVDRPSPAVSDILAEYDGAPFIQEIYHAEVPIIKGGKERWMDAENEHLDHLERDGDFDWVYVQDDDHWLEPVKAASLLPAALRSTEANAYFVTSLFFHGSSDTYTTTRAHRTILLWRHERGARCSGRLCLNCPDPLHEAYLFGDTCRDLPIPCLDYGSVSEAERFRLVKQFAGIPNPVSDVNTILLTPTLRRFPADYDPQYGEWLDLWAQHNG